MFNLIGNFFYFFNVCLKKLFIYFWPCWVFIAVHGLSLVEVSRGYSSLWCTGFSLQWLLLLWSAGSSCSVFSHCGASQGSNLCPLHWQVDSYPLYHQGNPWKPLNSSWRWLCHLTSPAVPRGSWAPALLHFCGSCPHRVPCSFPIGPWHSRFPSFSLQALRTEPREMPIWWVFMSFGAGCVGFWLFCSPLPRSFLSCVRSPRSSAQLERVPVLGPLQCPEPGTALPEADY